MERLIMMDDNQVSIRQKLSFGRHHPGEDSMDSCSKKYRGVPRDPSTHRIIEKRRRDRMNNCLADLSALIPQAYLKQGQGRIEKTEIIEMAIQYIKVLQSSKPTDGNNKERTQNTTEDHQVVPLKKEYMRGFKECSNEVINCLVSKQGITRADPICINLLQHLHNQLQDMQSELDKLGGNHDFAVEESDAKKDDVLALMTVSPASHQLENSDTVMPITQEMSPISNIQSISNTPSPGKNTNSEDSGSDQQNQQSVDQRVKNMLKGVLVHKRLQELDAESEISTSSQMSSWLCMSMRGDRDLSCCSDSAATLQSAEELVSQRDGSESSKSFSVYKYKNHIKQRFIEDKVPKEEDDMNVRDGNDQTFLPPPRMDDKSPSSSQANTSSDSLSQQGSDFSNGNGSTAYSSNSETQSVTSASANSLSTPTTLDLLESVPGFALAPGGTYYIPIITPASQLKPFLQRHTNLGICYPISIPVNFGGPHIKTQEIHVASSHGKSRKNHSSRKGDSGKGSSAAIRSPYMRT